MILLDVSSEDLASMRECLLMEGVYNRESKIREICMKMIALLEGIAGDYWFVRNFALNLTGEVTEQSLNDIATRMGYKVEEVDPSDIERRFHRKNALMHEVVEELRDIIKKMGAPS